VPTRVEEEYVNEDLLRIVHQRNPAYFSRLMRTLFNQTNESHKDFAYDFNSNLNIDPLTCLVSTQLDQHAIKVFARHAAVKITTPLIMPKTDHVIDLYKSSRVSEMLDPEGNIVQLPYDLTVPFARTLSHLRNDEFTYPLKRYSIGRVYRANNVGGQPKTLLECDFDIVFNQSDECVFEAETVKVVLEILEFLQKYSSTDCVVHINHSKYLENLMDTCRIPNNMRAKALECLEQKQPRSALQNAGIPKDSIERLLGFHSIPIDRATNAKDLGFSSALGGEVLRFANNLIEFGCTNVLFDPTLTYKPCYGGLIFQVCRKSKGKSGT
jgi:eukaryotic translation initiation factor 2-alpha kinase 4